MPPRPEGPSGTPDDDDAGTPDQGAAPPDDGRALPDGAGAGGDGAAGTGEDDPGAGGDGAAGTGGDDPAAGGDTAGVGNGDPAGSSGDDAARAGGDDLAGAGDVDERWAQIVDQLRDVDGAADDWTVGPAARPAPRRTPGRVVRAAQPPPEAAPVEASASGGRDWDGTAQYDQAEDALDAVEHFVPPDPAPVLGGNPLLTLAWSVVIGVPVLYVVMLVAWRNPPGWLPPVAGLAFLAGLTVLLWRMPHRRDDADDDSGAVV